MQDKLYWFQSIWYFLLLLYSVLLFIEIKLLLSFLPQSLYKSAHNLQDVIDVSGVCLPEHVALVMEGWSRQIVMMLLSEEGGDSTVMFISTTSHSCQAPKNELGFWLTNWVGAKSMKGFSSYLLKNQNIYIVSPKKKKIFFQFLHIDFFQTSHEYVSISKVLMSSKIFEFMQNGFESGTVAWLNQVVFCLLLPKLMFCDHHKADTKTEGNNIIRTNRNFTTYIHTHMYFEWRKNKKQALALYKEESKTVSVGCRKFLSKVAF